ncbi:hypothetical protein CLV63_113197 [Murinocardiopsis flavida]|uniref:Uncharacterized protein n=1 Tax=Murinocardiopsis flavida TaxID=645275 RepID=A0A2P8DFN3_9ACTN|nr:hypothetical protein [Murinocardiopsis flavida]PSK96034.1 hypothetical protein CLV63_113197 [Murinocardiopsis flavida]
MYFVGAVFCLALFAAIRKKVHWCVAAPLAVFGGALLALSWVGSWLTWALTGILGFVLGLLPEPVPAATLIAGASLFLLIVVAADVWKDRKLDAAGQYAAIGLPTLLLAAGGGVGATGTSVVSQIGGAATGLLGPLIGG